jgi:hypothetical protein
LLTHDSRTEMLFLPHKENSVTKAGARELEGAHKRCVL